MTTVDLTRAAKWAKQLLQDHPGTETYEAGIQLAAAQICEVLREFDLQAFKEKFKDADPAEYVKLLTCLLHLSDGKLKHEKYRTEVAERKAEREQALEDSKPAGMTPEQMAEFKRALREL